MMLEENTEESVRYLKDGTLAYDVIGICETTKGAQDLWYSTFMQKWMLRDG
jgi:hypothetical protein